MTLRTFTLERRCPVCDRNGSITFAEPLHDQSGKNTRAIAATGCWAITDDQRAVSRCKPQ